MVSRKRKRAGPEVRSRKRVARELGGDVGGGSHSSETGSAATSSIESSVASVPESPLPEPPPPAVVPHLVTHISSSSSSAECWGAAAGLESAAAIELQRLELKMNTRAVPGHRKNMVRHALSLGSRNALECLRKACASWRAVSTLETAPSCSTSLVVMPGTAGRHPALDAFSRAYQTFQRTDAARQYLEVTYRTDLAGLHTLFLTTIEALTHCRLPMTSDGSVRPHGLVSEAAISRAYDQMYWACYPGHPGIQGKACDPKSAMGRSFKTVLAHAEKWHLLQGYFGIGLLALVPPGENSWYMRLPLRSYPLFGALVAEVNHRAIEMAQRASDTVDRLWRRQRLPDRLLGLEHLQSICEAPESEWLALLEAVDVYGVAGVGPVQSLGWETPVCSTQYSDDIYSPDFQFGGSWPPVEALGGGAGI